MPTTPESLGLLDRAELARRWLDPATGPKPALRARLKAALPKADRVTRAAIKLSLGDASAAAKLLARDESPAALPWRVEAALQLGDAETAARLAPKLPPERSCLRSLAGELDALQAATGEEAPLATALTGLFAARRGDAELADAAFELAQKLVPGEGWPAGMKAAAFLPLDGSRVRALIAELDAAIALEPEAAWLYKLRGECQQRDGRAFGAHDDLDRAVALSLPHARLFLQRGQLCYFGKRYAQARADFTRAAKLSPGDPLPLWHRALVSWTTGDLAAALRDASECVRLDPGDPEYSFGRLRFAVLAAAPAAARKAIAGTLRDGGQDLRAGALFMLGTLEFRERRFRASAEAFEEAERLVRERRSVQKFADLGYSLIARAFERGKTMPPKKKTAARTVVIAGLGLNYPQHTTLEAMKALSECDTIFANLSGPQSAEFLSLFCKDVRPISYRVRNDLGKWIKQILSACKPGKTVAFVTRGHAMVSGYLAQKLLRACADAGVGVRNLSAISSIDDILAATGETLSASIPGIQAYESELLLAHGVTTPKGVPVIVYLSLDGQGTGADGHLDALCGRLTEHYGPDHAAALYAPPYGHGRLDWTTVGAVREALGRIRPDTLTSTVLYLAPVR